MIDNRKNIAMPVGTKFGDYTDFIPSSPTVLSSERNQLPRKDLVD